MILVFSRRRRCIVCIFMYYFQFKKDNFSLMYLPGCLAVGGVVVGVACARVLCHKAFRVRVQGLGFRFRDYTLTHACEYLASTAHGHMRFSTHCTHCYPFLHTLSHTCVCVCVCVHACVRVHGSHLGSEPTGGEGRVSDASCGGLGLADDGAGRAQL